MHRLPRRSERGLCACLRALGSRDVDAAPELAGLDHHDDALVRHLCEAFGQGGVARPLRRLDHRLADRQRREEPNVAGQDPELSLASRKDHVRDAVLERRAFGRDDAEHGISAAMGTTILGLAVAIPIIVLQTIIVTKTGQITDEIDEHAVKLINLLTGYKPVS